MIAKKEIPIIAPKDIITGDPKATVTITEFGDYESKECAAAHPTLKKVLAQYGEKVNFVFRHFPLLKIHQKAHKAAEAAIGAGQDGKFWEMHEIILAHQQNLGTISLNSYAKEAGIANKDFLNNLINGRYGWNVQDDLAEGIKLGVTTVPAFFVNGVKIDGDITVKKLSEGVDAALKTAGTKKKKTAVA